MKGNNDCRQGLRGGGEGTITLCVSTACKLQQLQLTQQPWQSAGDERFNVLLQLEPVSRALPSEHVGCQAEACACVLRHAEVSTPQLH